MHLGISVDLNTRSYFRNHAQNPEFFLLVYLGLYDICLTSILTWIEIFFSGSLNISSFFFFFLSFLCEDCGPHSISLIRFMLTG